MFSKANVVPCIVRLEHGEPGIALMRWPESWMKTFQRKCHQTHPDSFILTGDDIFTQLNLSELPEGINLNEAYWVDEITEVEFQSYQEMGLMQVVEKIPWPP